VARYLTLIYNLVFGDCYVLISSLLVHCTSQKLDGVDKIAADTDKAKKAVLEQRRTIVLAVVGGTPTDSPSLSHLLAKGYLDSVKTWLDDILSGLDGKIISFLAMSFSPPPLPAITQIALLLYSTLL